MRMLCRSVRLGHLSHSEASACAGASAGPSAQERGEPAWGADQVFGRGENIGCGERAEWFRARRDASPLRSAEWRTHAPGLSRAGGIGSSGLIQAAVDSPP